MRPFCLLFSLFNGSFYSQPPTETFFLSDSIKLLHRNLCQEGRGQRAIRCMTSHLRQCGGWTTQNSSEAQFPASCLRVTLQAPGEETQLSCGAWESLRSGDRDWELPSHKSSGRQESEAADSRPDQSVSLLSPSLPSPAKGCLICTLGKTELLDPHNHCEVFPAFTAAWSQASKRTLTGTPPIMNFSSVISRVLEGRLNGEEHLLLLPRTQVPSQLPHGIHNLL